MYNIVFSMVSDTSHRNTYTAEHDSTDIVDIAQRFGRAESGELVELLSVDGADASRDDMPAAGWDSQYQKYRRRVKGPTGWEWR